MKRWILPALALLAVSAPAARADVISTFEDLGVAPNSYINNAGPGGYFVSGGSSFNNSYDPTYQVFSGWAASSKTDTTTAGYTNQYSAITGSGAAVDSHHPPSATYAVAFTFGPGVTDPFHPDSSYVNLAAGYNPYSLQVTNTTYDYLSMKNGDTFARKFSQANKDFFLLTITGYNGLNGTGRPSALPGRTSPTSRTATPTSWTRGRRCTSPRWRARRACGSVSARPTTTRFTG